MRDPAPVVDAQIATCFDKALTRYQRSVFEFVIMQLDTARVLMRCADGRSKFDTAERLRRKALVILQKVEGLLPKMMVISSSERKQLEPKLKSLKQELSACGLLLEDEQRRAKAASE